MIKKVSTTLTSDAYGDGDVLGGVLSLEKTVTAGRITPILRQVMIQEASTAMPALDIFLLDSNVSSDTTITDNTIVDLDDADLVKIIGVVSTTASIMLNDNSVAVIPNLNIPINVADPHTGTLFILPVARAASVADPGAISFTFSFEA